MKRMTSSATVQGQYDVFTPEGLAMARELRSPEEERAYALQEKIRKQYKYPWNQILHRFEPYRANRILARYPEKGEYLHRFAKDSNSRLWNFKVIYLTKFIRTLKPKIILEFGAGGSTALFAELLKQNYEEVGVKGEIYSFEQSPEYFESIQKNFPEKLRPWLNVTLCPIIYERMNGYRAIRYDLPSLPNKDIDYVFVDGPAPVRGNCDFKHPIFSGDLIHLARQGITAKRGANDGRWFNLQFFRDLIGDIYTFTPSVQYRGFFIKRK